LGSVLTNALNIVYESLSSATQVTVITRYLRFHRFLNISFRQQIGLNKMGAITM